ncbi:hypothetical protein NM688_g1488 [Phlebia brevispora]|uniref:Uncharacterized protein n=1 Tax=Phlebia brevispora TaxID=194682 RepID=A0ACC1TBZ6_9APHY|nr:hypothetical protein NM688_g1488 [Phlebia brevispora]
MKIAVEGCCHGELDAIYSHIATLENANSYKVSLLIICGDFQAVRNMQDLQCMAVPDKYKQLGEFYKYYTGEKTAPILTIVIGGNHEASNYFWELYHGGWLAPNIYFLGHAGCVQVNGIRIAGASGIFQHYDFAKGHFERVPYDRSAMRSIYHIRQYNILRLSLLSSPDIFLSHDWPQSIEQYGDLRGLLRHKPFFRSDIEKGALGSPPMMGLLRTLKPKWWFSAHLHTRFEARVVHEPDVSGPTNTQEAAKAEGTNPEEIAIDDIDTEVGAPRDASTGDTTTAPSPLAHTKILGGTLYAASQARISLIGFRQVVDVPEPPNFVPPSSPSSPSNPKSQNPQPSFTFDPEWLAITRAYNPYMSLGTNQLPYPNEVEARAAVQRELVWIKKHVYGISTSESSKDALMGLSKTVESCQKFCITAPAHGQGAPENKTQPPHYPNPQTAAFCQMLGIENKIDIKP